MASFKTGHHSLQGRRQSMEDEVLIVEQFEVPESKSGPYSIFAVFDGHGGKDAAVFCRKNLLGIVKRMIGEGMAMDKILKESFLELDDRFLAGCGKDTSGSTAVVCIVDHSKKKLWSGNIGDARAILCQGGKTDCLTIDHKASVKSEQDRVLDSGGFIIHSRVMGELAVTRAFGDSSYKKQTDFTPETDDGTPAPPTNLIIAEPHIQERALGDDTEFLFLACDGVFDVMKNEDVVSLVQEMINDKSPPSKISKEVASHCIDDLRSADNVSVIVAVVNKE